MVIRIYRIYYLFNCTHVCIYTCMYILSLSATVLPPLLSAGVPATIDRALETSPELRQWSGGDGQRWLVRRNDL